MKADFIPGSLSNPALRRLGHAVRETSLPLPSDMPISELIQLYTQIETALPDELHPIVQFLSVNNGGERVALEMAWAAASALGKDILILDGASSLSLTSQHPALTHKNGDGAAAESVSQVSLKDFMVKIVGHGLYVVDLQDAYGRGALSATEEIIGNLRDLSAHFDMIVVVAPPVEVDPFGTVLARHVDGNVIVIEAEKTRRNAALRLRDALISSGRPVLGVVMNNQRNHIPQWLGWQ